MNSVDTIADRIRATPLWKKNIVAVAVGLGLGGLFAMQMLAPAACSPTSRGDWQVSCSTLTAVVDGLIGSRVHVSIQPDVIAITPGMSRLQYERIYTNKVPTRFKLGNEEYVLDELGINPAFPVTMTVGDAQVILKRSEDGTWRAQGATVKEAISGFDGTGQVRLRYTSSLSGRMSVLLPTSGMSAAWAELR